MRRDLAEALQRMAHALRRRRCRHAGIGLCADPGSRRPQGTLIMYCGVDENWCRAMTTEYQKQTGVNVQMTRMSAGEIYARLRAEKENPQADIWWGGTGDPHLQAAEEGLTEDYKSAQLPKLREWAQKQAERSKYRTVGIYLGALGFGYNTEEVAQTKLSPPACWADLIKPEFKGEVQMADPNSSGTAWTALATFVQLMGEEPAFVYLKKLHANINEYTKSGAAPAQAADLGETLIGIAFQHDVIDVAIRGKPVQVVSPCEGTGYEIGSMSLVKGGKNGAEAREVLRMGADRRGAEDRRRQSQLPGAVQRRCADPAAGTGSEQDQADRLRFRANTAHPPNGNVCWDAGAPR